MPRYGRRPVPASRWRVATTTLRARVDSRSVHRGADQRRTEKPGATEFFQRLDIAERTVPEVEIVADHDGVRARPLVHELPDESPVTPPTAVVKSTTTTSSTPAAVS